MGGKRLLWAVLTVLLLFLAIEDISCRRVRGGSNTRGGKAPGRKQPRGNPEVCRAANKNTFADIKCRRNAKLVEVKVEAKNKTASCSGMQVDQMVQGYKCQTYSQCKVSLEPHFIVTSEDNRCIGFPPTDMCLSANCTKKGVEIEEFLPGNKEKTTTNKRGIMQSPDYPWLIRQNENCTVIFRAPAGKASRNFHYTFRKVSVGEEDSLTLAPHHGQSKTLNNSEWHSGSLENPGDVTLTLSIDPNTVSTEGYRVCFLWSNRKKLPQSNDVCRHNTDAPSSIKIRRKPGKRDARDSK